MGDAKLLHVKPIDATLARAATRRLHYSGNVVNNSQLHVGVFYAGKLEGVMQLGPPMQRNKVLPLVANTAWNGMLEINRMAFSENLPRNSESRALGVVFRMLRRMRPDIGWLLSYSDAAQCGDGTIYRASGFLLTQIKPNKSMIRLPDGSVCADISMRGGTEARRNLLRKYGVAETGQSRNQIFSQIGARAITGYQMRYIYFLNPNLRKNLTVKTLPYSEIARRGAGMYKGVKRATSIGADAPGFQPGEGGSQPTVALQSTAAADDRQSI